MIAMMPTVSLSNAALPQLLLAVLILTFAQLNLCEENDSYVAAYRRIASSPKRTWNDTYVDKLRKALLINYDKYSRYQEIDDKSIVQFDLKVWHVDADEINSTLSVSGRLVMTWYDAKLKWNPEDFGGVDVLKVMDHEIWQPNVYLLNWATSSAEAVNRYGNPYAMAFSTGQVLWIPPTKIDILCNFDLYYWPFDTQRCPVEFVLWSSVDKEFPLKIYEKELDFAYEATTWEFNMTNYPRGHQLIGSSGLSFYCLHFDLILTRISGPYVAIVITPILAVISLILIQYWMPPYSGQRVILNCFTAIITAFLLAYFNHYTAVMGSSIPLIVIFYSTSMFLVCISTMESIFVRSLSGYKHRQPPPEFVKGILKQRLGKVLLLDKYISQFHARTNLTVEEVREYHHPEFDDKEEERDEIVRSVERKKTDLEFEWNVLILAIDRIFFVAYSVVFLVLALMYVF